ncbi:MAG TPA: T9SS type A sorting domain-containing protein [Bacteroides sp.]|nr:T9SS type A sorting domain-containing protein [Bacteroides sp.]
MRILFQIIVFLFTGSLLCSQDLENPLVLDNEWPGYSIGDPYVLKHRGIYYLYCSTKDSETGVKCWSSRDLVTWDYEGLCATDPVTKGAYAPEVIYWNGTFYMYTSPAGNGHYVLSGPSPAGPFEVVTNNLGKSIDGSVYIDDDAGMYFYHASSQGIMGCPMPGPTSIGTGTSLGAHMNNGWTEGPCVFKRNGKYYMIYTGNHVISKGYRIDYATGTGPLDRFEPATLQNPILVDALGLHTGLGHGSVFIGPDLDSYFLTYHNLVSGVGPFRRLNFDRIAWNGDKMVLMGPTTFIQHNPLLPDGYDYFDRDEPGSHWIIPSGGRWHLPEEGILAQDSSPAGEAFIAVLDSTTAEDYTAEFNLRETFRADEEAALGVVFGYTDEGNYGVALLNSQTNQLEISFMTGGSRGTSRQIDMPAGMLYSEWHTIRIEKYLDRFKFFVDGMLKDSADGGPDAGKIGYITSGCRGEFGFIAFSNKVNGSGTFDVYKPVPGKLPAMQYRTGGEDIGYHKVNPSGEPDRNVRRDEADLIPVPLGGYALESLEAGDWFSYRINVELDRLYNINLVYATGQDDCKIRWLLDGSSHTDAIDLPSTGGNDRWRSFLIKDTELPQGFHTLRLEVIGGTFHLYHMEFVKANNASFDNTISFDGSFGTNWKYEDGDWQIIDKKAVIDGFGKRAYGSDAWRDYTVETDLMFTRSMNAGLIFRVNNPALGGAGNDPALGTDFLQGYFVGFNFGTVVLGKHNYGWQSLATASASLSMNTWYHLRVLVVGDRIRVFLDDMTQPVIDFTDPLPLINGMVGLRSFNTGVTFDNLHVTSDLLTSVNDLQPIPSPGFGFKIYPNPAAELFTLQFHQAEKRIVRLLNLNGKTMLSRVLETTRTDLSVEDLDPGIYIIRAESATGIHTGKLVVQ